MIAALRNALSHKPILSAFAILSICIEAGLSVGPALIAKNIVDAGVISKDMTGVVYWSTILMLLTFTVGGIVYFSQYAFAVIAEDSVYSLRTKAISSTLVRNTQFVIGDVPTIVERIQRDILAWREFLALSAPQLLRSTIGFVVALAALAFLDNLLLIVALAATIPYLTIICIMRKYVKNASAREMNRRATATSMISQLYSESAHQTIVTLNASSNPINYITERLFGQRNASLSLLQTSINLRLSLDVIAGIATTSAYLVASIHAAEGTVSSGGIVAAAALFMKLLNPIGSVVNIVTMASGAKLSLSRIAELTKGANGNDYCGKPISSSMTIPEMRIHYSKDRQPICVDPFKVERGVPVRIAGSSGAGKTTIMRTICGLISANSYVDACSTDWTSIARSCYISAKPWIIDGTIKDNILLFSDPSLSEINSAIDACCLREFVNRLPDGLDTVISKSTQVSSGEMQRIGIVRCILAKPDLLVLDEATSNLDPRTERAVLKNVSTLMSDKFFIYSTHKNSDLHSKVVHVGDSRA